MATITGLDPASGPEGTEVSIFGTGFLENTTRVRFGSYDCGFNYTVISDTAISAIVPSGSGTVSISVTDLTGTYSGGSFVYAAYEGGSNSVPTVTGVSPGQTAGFDGSGGDSVTISGTGLSTAIAVYFGPTAATARQADFTYSTATGQITAIAPPGEPGTTTYVFVENNYGVSVDADSDNDFYYQSSAVPTVTSLVPNQMLPGFEIEINGTGFTYADAVRFGTIYADSFRIESDVLIKAIVPGNISFLGSSVEVYVQNPWGESTTHATFTYSTLGTLKTAISCSPGTPGQSPRDNWIVTSSNVAVTLTASYSGAPASYIESTWYRIDNGSNLEYSAPFNVSGEGSHKIEFWSVGKDGIVETTNVAYINIVATATPTLTVTQSISQLRFSWTAINIPGCFYELYVDGTATPTTLVGTLSGTSFIYVLAAGAAGVYARVRCKGPDGTFYTYSNITGPTQSLTVAASDLADNAITTAKLAPALKPPPIFTTAQEPALPNSTYPSGSYYYNTTTNTLRINNAGTWQDASPQSLAVIGQVVAGTIEAAAIGATEIAADSIFAKHLIVADYENLCPNANSELSTTGKTVTWNSDDIDFRGVVSTNPYRGSQCRGVPGNVSARDLVLCEPIPAKSGDQFRLSAKSCVGTAGTCQLVIAGVDAAGSDVGTAVSTGTTSTSYQTDSPSPVFDYVEYTVPTGSGAAAVVAVRAYLRYTGAAGTTGYYDDILFRKMLAGNLVVDGAITAAKIAANTITGDQIHANVALDAPVITGGTIQTDTSGPRTVLTDVFEGVTFYSGVNGETASEIHAGVWTGGAYLGLTGPDMGAHGPADLQLISTDTDSSASLRAGPTGTAITLCDDGTINYVASTAAGDGHFFQGDVDTTQSLSVANKLSCPKILVSRRTAIDIHHEFTGTTMNYADAGNLNGELYKYDMGNGLAASGGATAVDGGDLHPGCMEFYSASSAVNSGRAILTNGAALRCTYDGDYMEFVVMFPSNTSTIRNRFGTMDSTSSTAPTVGAWFLCTGTGSATTIQGYVNGTATGATAYNAGASTWYTLRIYTTNSSSTYFEVLNESGTQLWSGSVAAKASSRGFFGFHSYNTTAANVYTLVIDYMGFWGVGRTR